MATNPKLKSRRKSPDAKQKDLVALSVEALTKKSKNIYGIFLVRQGLRSRSEQFMAIAVSHKLAVEFCRNTLTPKYCKDCEKQSLHYIGKGNERLSTIYDQDHLMIKGLDFVRTEEGRTNSNPLWYWNIANINVVHSTSG